jgi:hypothetical protein
MKKRLWFIIVIVLALLIIAVTPVVAKKEPRSISFAGAHNYYSKGLVFKFSYTGQFKDYEFKNAVVWWNGHTYTLDCNISNETTITCVAQAGLRQRVGRLVSGVVAGYRFFATIPAPKNFATVQYCYSIWDHWDFAGYQWADMSPYLGGPHCQDDPAQEGDNLYYEFYLDGTLYSSDTTFYNNGEDSACTAPNYGPAYYYDGAVGCW